MEDGVNHRYIIIIVIIRAGKKGFTQRQCKKLTSKLSRKKVMSKIPVIMDTKTAPFQLVNIGAKNFGTGFWNTYFGWFGWFLTGLL